MTVGELIDLLNGVDRDAVLTMRESQGALDRHIRPAIQLGQFTVTLYAGPLVTEEDLA